MKQKFLWLVIGGTAGLFVFMLLNAIFLREGSHNPVPSSPTISPPPLAPIETGSPDDKKDNLVQVPAVPPQEPLPPPAIPPAQTPLDKAAIENHRKMVISLNADLRQRTGNLYGPVFNQLNLPASLQQKVIDILMQQQQQLEEQAFKAAESGSLPAPPSPEEMQAEQAQQDNQLRSVLGDGFAQFNQYRTTIPDRTIIDQMNQQGANLSESQSQQLLQILTDARQQIQGATPNLNSLPVDQAVVVIQKQQTLLQETVSDRVQSILTPDQGKTLQGVFSRLRIAP
jgi:hypothetical protein